jgi:hypothetical protein
MVPSTFNNSTGSFPSLLQIDILRPSVHLKTAAWRKPGALLHSEFNSAFVNCCLWRSTTELAAARREASI